MPNAALRSNPLAVPGYGFSGRCIQEPPSPYLPIFAYNFIKIHRTLRCTPAMAAGVTDRLWEVSDLVALLEAQETEEKLAA